MNCPHCDKPIDEHEAGRETDTCVAFAVMGFNHHQPIPMPAGGVAPADAEIVIPESDESFTVAWGTRAIGGTYPFFDGQYLWTEKGKGGRLWSPSIDIAAAWEVVERAEIHTIRQVASQEDDSPSEWAAIKYLDPITHGVAISAHLAICRAALKAVE